MEPKHSGSPKADTESSLRFGFGKFLLLPFLSLYIVPLFAQELEIRLVDGRTGRPMTEQASHVNVWVGSERKEAIAIPTDRNGIARLELTLDTGRVNVPNHSGDSGSTVVANPIVKYSETMRINVPYALCVAAGTNYSWLSSQSFLTKQIVEHGYVSPNTCGKAKASPNPGQVTLFVRPLTWLEKLKE